MHASSWKISSENESTSIPITSIYNPAASIILLLGNKGSQEEYSPGISLSKILHS